MKPSQLLLDRICLNIDSKGFFIIQTSNKEAWFNRIFRPRNVLTKREFHTEFGERNFEVRSIGRYAIPPIFWALLPQKSLEFVDSILTKLPLLSISYLHIAKRI